MTSKSPEENAYTTIDYSIDDRILTITLNRPDQLNAFTVTMADELEDAFTRANSDDEVAAVVVTGAGRAFCADTSINDGKEGVRAFMEKRPAHFTRSASEGIPGWMPWRHLP